MASVPSVENESTTTISSATPINDLKHRSIFFSSLKVIMVADNFTRSFIDTRLASLDHLDTHRRPLVAFDPSIFCFLTDRSSFPCDTGDTAPRCYELKKAHNLPP